MWWVLGLTWGMICVIALLPAAWAAKDWGYCAISVTLAAYLVVTLTLRTFIWREPKGLALATTEHE
jgi:hypothetical protein